MGCAASTSANAKTHVVIVGGSMGGLAAARAAEKRGFRVTVIEVRACSPTRLAGLCCSTHRHRKSTARRRVHGARDNGYHMRGRPTLVDGGVSRRGPPPHRCLATTSTPHITHPHFPFPSRPRPTHPSPRSPRTACSSTLRPCARPRRPGLRCVAALAGASAPFRFLCFAVFEDSVHEPPPVPPTRGRSPNYATEGCPEAAPRFAFPARTLPLRSLPQ